MSFVPNPEQSRWLRKWQETGLVFQGERHIKTDADFERAKISNIAHFEGWSRAVLQNLTGEPATIATDEKPTRQRREKPVVELPAVEPQNTQGNEVE